MSGVEMQVCSACGGQGVIIQEKQDTEGKSVMTTETCNGCGGNGMVQGQVQ